MEALESFGGVCRESVCETLVGEFESGLGEFAADELFVSFPDVAYLSPDGVFDLSFRGCGRDDQCLLVCH